MNEFDRFIEEYLGKYLELPFNSCKLFKDKPKDMAELLGKSSFELNGDNVYVATFSFGTNVTSDMVDVEVNDEERMITVSYSYKRNNSTYSSAVTETLPVDGDVSTIMATLENGNLVLTMRKNVDTNTPKTILIKHK